MKKVPTKYLPILFLLSILVAACGGSTKETDIAVIVALTQTAAVLQAQPASQTESAPTSQSNAPTAASVATDTPASVLKGYQPYDAASCASLSAAISANSGLASSVAAPVPFNDFIKAENGTACQISYSATGAMIALPAGKDLYGVATSTFQSLGWTEDMNYGAGGPTGMQTAFRKDASLCLVAYERVPADRSVCDPNQPIATCFDKLSPDQIQISLTLTCSTYYP